MEEPLRNGSSATPKYKAVVSDYLLLTLCDVAYLRPQRTNQQIKTITHMIQVIYSSI